jgi:dTDP-4-amino-4,6-dideoxygalactose transaminase
MRVPLLDLTAQYRALRAEIEPALREVCDSQQFILGPRVRALEEAVAAYSGARFAVGVSSGTDALLVALMALGVGPGDAVLTTPFSFFATAGVVARLGASPVFCDIADEDFNLSPAAVRTFLENRCERRESATVDRLTGRRVRALIPVDLYGQMADMSAFALLARDYDLALIEDAAQAIGAELPDGTRAGSAGDIGCFSFFPTKNLGAFGDAGMCTTNEAWLAERLRTLRVHGAEKKYFHSMVGGNFRLDELQAAVLEVKLRHLDAWTAARQRNAAHYCAAIAAAGLEEKVRVPFIRPGGRHIFNQFVVRVERRDALRQFLLEHEVGAEVYYPLPLHQQECFSQLGQSDDACPRARAAAQEVLALPIFPELTSEQLDYVVEQLAAFYS